jgi:phytoene dehydrogenase-like protein
VSGGATDRAATGGAVTDGARYDAVVIGAGHNGLVAAAYLARAGRRVLVLERRELIGGATITEERWDGFRLSTLADGAPRLAPGIATDLDLGSHGVRIRAADPVVVSLAEDAAPLSFWRDDARTAGSLAQVSDADARHWDRFATLMRRLAGVVGTVMEMIPPDLGRPDRADIRSALSAAIEARRLGRRDLGEAVRVLPMSVADLAQEWFEDARVQATIAASGIEWISWGPSAAGTAYTLLHGAAFGRDGVFGSSGFVIGGMGALCDGLASVARAAGAVVETGAPVTSVLVEDDRVTGVALADGREIRTGTVLSSADPRTTFLELVPPGTLDPTFIHEVRRIKYRGTVARVHLGLDRLPAFTGIQEERLLAGRLRIAPSLRYLERAYDDAKWGQISDAPYIELTVPTLTDPSRAPGGAHLLSATVRYTPFDRAWDDATAGALGDRVLAILERHAPGITDLVRHRQVTTPLDLEQVHGLTGGNPVHGELTLDQLFHMRPVPGWARYRMPVDGLYLCGAGAHPGGGVTGVPGRNAARVALRAGRHRP